MGIQVMASSARAAAARGRAVRSPATGGATRREFSAAVGAWTSGQQGNGAGLGRGERSAGWREQAGARGGPTRAGGFAGALGRLRQAGQKRGGGPRRRKIFFQIKFLRNFQMPSFKYHFEQENDLF